MKIFPLGVFFSSMFVLYSSSEVAKEEPVEDSLINSRRIRPIRTGRYIPELYGAAGKYKVDLSGKYKHNPVPYDGGYGDRGEKYLHLVNEARNGNKDYLSQNYDEVDTGRNERSDHYQDDDCNYSEYTTQTQEFYNEEGVMEYTTTVEEPENSTPSVSSNAQNDVDHGLRYVIDLNYHPKKGWHVIQLQWAEDEKEQYRLVHKAEKKILPDSQAKVAPIDDSVSQ